MATVHVDMTLTDAEAVTVRDVAGAGSQIELLIRTRQGVLAVRLVGARGKVIRLTDLRQRDKAQRAKRHLTSPLAFADVFKGAR